MKRIIFGVVLASALATVPVAAAPRTQASIILNAPVQLSSSLSAGAASIAWPTLGDTVTFTVTYPDSVRSEFVYVKVACFQGPDHVFAYGATNVPDGEFLLGGTNSYWLTSGGSASCVADLFYWSKGGKYTVLASTDFEVAG